MRRIIAHRELICTLSTMDGVLLCCDRKAVVEAWCEQTSVTWDGVTKMMPPHLFGWEGEVKLNASVLPFDGSWTLRMTCDNGMSAKIIVEQWDTKRLRFQGHSEPPFNIPGFPPDAEG